MSASAILSNESKIRNIRMSELEEGEIVDNPAPRQETVEFAPDEEMTEQLPIDIQFEEFNSPDPEDLIRLQETIQEMDSIEEQTYESEDDLIIDNDCDDSSTDFNPAPWCGEVEDLLYLDKYKRLIAQSPFYAVLAEQKRDLNDITHIKNTIIFLLQSGRKKLHKILGFTGTQTYSGKIRVY
jgi:hypothetical protein